MKKKIFWDRGSGEIERHEIYFIWELGSSRARVVLRE